MSKVYLNDYILTNIANAIREKNGTSNRYLPGNMPNAIKALSGETEWAQYVSGAYAFCGAGSGTIKPFTLTKDATFEHGTHMFDSSFWSSIDVSHINVSDGNFTYMFSGARATTVTGLDTLLNRGNVFSVSYMFQSAKFTSAINFSPSNAYINALNYTFANCNASSITFEKALAAINNFSYAFSNLQNSALKTLDLSKLNPQTVNNCSYMFYNSKYLETVDISNMKFQIGTSNLSHMFDSCQALTSISANNIVMPDTSNYMHNCTSMFTSCKSLTNLDLSWLITYVSTTNLSYMFNGCSALETLDIRNIRFTGNIGIFTGMFNGCTSLKTIYVKNPTCKTAVENELSKASISGVTVINVE